MRRIGGSTQHSKLARARKPAATQARHGSSMAFEARRALLMGSPEKCGSASASVRQALAEAASSGSTTLTTCCASAACANHRVPGGAPLINCKHSRFSTLLYFLADKRICQARRRGQCAPLAAPELGPCGSSGRAWWLWAARRSQVKRVAHWPIELAASARK